jgi:hypothetical protein
MRLPPIWRYRFFLTPGVIPLDFAVAIFAANTVWE